MNYTSVLIALFATLAVLASTVTALPSAVACSPALPTPLAVVPANGDRVGPMTQILVIGEGQRPSADDDFSLSDRAGDQIEVEVEVLGRAGTFQWVTIYRPEQALNPTAYDFFASYRQDGDDAETVATSFEVRQQEAATLAKPRVSSWDTVLFSPVVQGLCESYSSATRLTIERAREGDSPLWYEVELSNEDRSEVATRAVVPGFGDGDGVSMSREFHEQFAVGCVSVTPVGASGERGESFESCEAALCGTADGEEDTAETVWETLDECDGSAPGQPPAGGSTGGGSTGGSSSSNRGCSAGGAAPPRSHWWTVVALLLALPCWRRRE